MSPMANLYIIHNTWPSYHLFGSNSYFIYYYLLFIIKFISFIKIQYSYHVYPSINSYSNPSHSQYISFLIIISSSFYYPIHFIFSPVVHNYTCHHIFMPDHNSIPFHFIFIYHLSFIISPLHLVLLGYH